MRVSPVIATNLGGPAEIVLQDETGVLVPAERPGEYGSRAAFVAPAPAWSLVDDAVGCGVMGCFSALTPPSRSTPPRGRVRARPGGRSHGRRC